jgi:hypothetical protein
MKKVFFMFVAAVFVWAAWIYTRDYFRYHPAKNPHPKYFLTVKGHVDPAMKKHLKVTWGVGYSTTNPDCDETYNWFEGAWGPRDTDVTYAVHIQANGDYQLNIPLDGLHPGYCAWETGDVYYSFNYYHFKHSADSDTSFGLRKTGRKQAAPIKQTVICQPSGCDLTKDSVADLSYNLSSKVSHQGTINFELTNKEGRSS